MRTPILLDVQMIYYWPNGDWCYRGCEENFMLNKGLSDDYGAICCPDTWDEEKIDSKVEWINSGHEFLAEIAKNQGDNG